MLSKAEEIAGKHQALEDDIPEPAVDDTSAESFRAQLEEQKTAALNARTLSEEEMIAIGREFIIGTYELNDEQTSRLELYTNSFKDSENSWYEMVDSKPCFKVEYLLYAPYTTEMYDNGESRPRMEKDGYYNVFVNVETGVVENYEYNSALAGQG